MKLFAYTHGGELLGLQPRFCLLWGLPQAGDIFEGALSPEWAGVLTTTGPSFATSRFHELCACGFFWGERSNFQCASSCFPHTPRGPRTSGAGSAV